jgi:hypothetical protein
VTSEKKPLFELVIGKTFTVADGQRVLANSISHSYRYPNLALINEEHFIDYLELAAQLNGETLDDSDRAIWKEMISQSKERK